MKILKNASSLIIPYSEFRQQKSSIDITASNQCFREVFPNTNDESDFTIDLKLKQPLHLEEVIFEDYIVIPPSKSITVVCNEEVDLPHSVCGMFQSVGLLNQSNIATIGSIWIQPKWRGKLNITLINHNSVHSYKLYKNTVVGQLVFFEME